MLKRAISEALLEKFGQTIGSDYFYNLEQYVKLSKTKVSGTVIYGGKDSQQRGDFKVRSWSDL